MRTCAAGREGRARPGRGGAAIILARRARASPSPRGWNWSRTRACCDEVAGLVEWPVALIGEFEAHFLDIPPEVDPRHHPGQPEVLRPAGRGGAARQPLRPYREPDREDGGETIVAGNERVIQRACPTPGILLATDLATCPTIGTRPRSRSTTVSPSSRRSEWSSTKSSARSPSASTGSKSLTREIAPKVGADAELAARAARLAKADLVTEMVGEFPELQGLMGRYYAAAQGEEPSVAAAVEEHYKPQGPNDRAPNSPVSIAAALADKLDTLGAFWAIDEKPTGSKDPYALRRAALGVIRIVLENGLRLPLIAPLNAAVWGALLDVEFAREDEAGALVQSLEKRGFPKGPELEAVVGAVSRATRRAEVPDDARLRAITGSLLAFFADRLKVYLRDKGARYDLIDAVFALPGQDDLLTIVWRVEALGRLLDTEDGQNLLTGYRRAANILRAEEKKDGAGAFAHPHDPSVLVLKAEKDLADALAAAGAAARERIGREDFEGAMRALASLRAPVDAFFLDVTVNADDPALRLNRLRLLGELREAVHAVADFSRVAG